jgi:hypothetical protein
MYIARLGVVCMQLDNLNEDKYMHWCTRKEEDVAQGVPHKDEPTLLQQAIEDGDKECQEEPQSSKSVDN